MFLYEFVNSIEANHIMMWPANYQHFFTWNSKLISVVVFVEFRLISCVVAFSSSSKWQANETREKNEAIVNMNVGKSLKKCRWPWSNDIDDIIVIKWARFIMKTKSKKKKRAKSQTNVELRACVCVCVLFLLRKISVFCIIYLFI